MSLTFFFQTPHQVVWKRTVNVTDIFLSDSPPKGPPSFFPCTPESINSKPESNKRVCHKTLSVSHSQGIFCLSGSEARYAENLQLLANFLPCLHMYSVFWHTCFYIQPLFLSSTKNTQPRNSKNNKSALKCPNLSAQLPSLGVDFCNWRRLKHCSPNDSQIKLHGQKTQTVGLKHHSGNNSQIFKVTKNV